MVELLVATTNQEKFAEVQAFLRPLGFKILSGQTLGHGPPIVEDGATFEENALKKARAWAEYSGYLALADDSGLEVDALNGAPGIYSARYSGEAGNDEKNNQKLLEALKGVAEEKRTARFICALALCARGIKEKEWTVRESCEGRIAFAPQGKQGFGYDPLFYYPPLGKTFGQIDRELKATVSHRGKALKQLAAMLPSLGGPKSKP